MLGSDYFEVTNRPVCVRYGGFAIFLEDVATSRLKKAGTNTPASNARSQIRSTRKEVEGGLGVRASSGCAGANTDRGGIEGITAGESITIIIAVNRWGKTIQARGVGTGLVMIAAIGTMVCRTLRNSRIRNRATLSAIAPASSRPERRQL